MLKFRYLTVYLLVVSKLSVSAYTPPDSVDLVSETTRSPLHSALLIKPSSDSTWLFHPFGVNLSPGISLPLGKLSEFVKPAFGFGFTFTIRFMKSVSLEGGLLFKFLNNRKPVQILYRDSMLYTNTPLSASIGGWIHYKVYRNRNIYTELVGGLSFEPLSTDVIANNDKDSIVSIKTIGCSFGFNNWFACFGHQNLGLKFLYQFSPYKRDKILISDLGGHTLTFAILYRFPKRDPAHYRYQWLM